MSTRVLRWSSCGNVARGALGTPAGDDREDRRNAEGNHASRTQSLVSTGRLSSESKLASNTVHCGLWELALFYTRLLERPLGYVDST